MSDIVLYDRQGTVNGNTSATFKELKKLIKSEKNISGDITIEKIGISEISNGKFKVHVKYESDGKLMEIDLPFENCKDLSYYSNSNSKISEQQQYNEQFLDSRYWCVRKNHNESEDLIGQMLTRIHLKCRLRFLVKLIKV